MILRVFFFSYSIHERVCESRIKNELKIDLKSKKFNSSNLLWISRFLHMEMCSKRAIKCLFIQVGSRRQDSYLGCTYLSRIQLLGLYWLPQVPGSHKGYWQIHMCYRNTEEGEVGMALDGGTWIGLRLGTGRCYSLFSNSLVTNKHLCVKKWWNTIEQLKRIKQLLICNGPLEISTKSKRQNNVYRLLLFVLKGGRELDIICF